jgi:mono/diheme cytochrome c family protein
MNKGIKRALLVVLAILFLVALAVILVQTFHEPGSEQESAPVANRAEQLVLGEYLVRAGNCMACHTTQGGKAFAGGRAISTPFGNIYTSNITPDLDTGIGHWTADDFWRAIHHGKSKDGSFLYPAFPYPNYTKVSRTDADAMHAYFMSLTAVRQKNRDHQLDFPYNNRILLAFWRALYFTPGEFQAQASQSAQWNRGAYLVQGLGHCAACHTGRNALGGTLAENNLSGAYIQSLNWHAASLTSHAETGLGEWEVEEIASLLKTGVSRRGAALGPMAEVVSGSLQYLSDGDTLAMASYLKTIPQSDTVAASRVAYAPRDPAAVLLAGARIYQQRCAECHGEDGAGEGSDYPPLAGNRSLSTSPVNAIRIVLNGGYPPSTAGNPRPIGMPPFGHALDDGEVAAVVSYLRTSWGNQGTLISPVEVARLRGVPGQ